MGPKTEHTKLVGHGQEEGKVTCSVSQRNIKSKECFHQRRLCNARSLLQQNGARKTNAWPGKQGENVRGGRTVVYMPARNRPEIPRA